VAIVASSLRLAGAEKQTFYMARALHQAGLDVEFFHLGGGGHYEAVLRQTGVRVRRIYHPNHPWIMLARLVGSLRRWRPHIVLAAQFGDLRYAAAAGRLCHALTLGGVRSDGNYELDGHGCFSRGMAWLAHGLVTNSRRARLNLMSRGIPGGKIAVLSNVIDLGEFDQRTAQPSDFSLPPDSIIATAVGSLQPCKRFDRFLEALALARRAEPALAGVIAGTDCGAQAVLRARADALGLGPRNLVFLGEVTNVPALLARSALLVLTSDYEGFPNVILEAMAARLPVISVPAGDASLIVKHGKTGYVVESDDTPSMSVFMRELAQSPPLRRNLGEAGRKHVELEHGYESLTGHLLATFHVFASQQQRHSLCGLLERGVSQNHPKTPAGSLRPQQPAAQFQPEY
jgi:glycosyltransferase involved in cell wall biosynthesis